MMNFKRILAFVLSLPHAAVTLMNVKCKESGICFREPCYFHFQNGSIAAAEQSHHTTHIWVFLSSAYLGNCYWTHVMLHHITPLSNYGRGVNLVTCRFTDGNLPAALLLYRHKGLP